MPRMLTDEEAAALLKVTPRSLTGMRERGTGPKFVRVGHQPRYDEADVNEWIKSRKVGSLAEERAVRNDSAGGKPLPKLNR